MSDNDLAIAAQAGAVELLDRQKRSYQEVWDATVHFAQNLMVDEVGYWLGLYRIKRDMLWTEVGYEQQEDWLYDLSILERFQGGCATSTFHEKMRMIDDLVDSGVTEEMIVHALTQPTATKILLEHREQIPEGETVQTVLVLTTGQGPAQASATIADVLGLKRVWISRVSYNMGAERMKLIISEEDGASVDTRTYIIYEMPHEDAAVLARAAHKKLEMEE